jgi:hypothetical protein
LARVLAKITGPRDMSLLSLFLAEQAQDSQLECTSESQAQGK